MIRSSCRLRNDMNPRIPSGLHADEILVQWKTKSNHRRFIHFLPHSETLSRSSGAERSRRASNVNEKHRLKMDVYLQNFFDKVLPAPEQVNKGDFISLRVKRIVNHKWTRTR